MPASELPIDSTASALDMANAMFGNGISVVSASYTGAENASGIYTNGDFAAADITPSDSGVILSTGNASDVTNSSGDMNTTDRTTSEMGEGGDAQLSQVAGGQTFDAAIIEAEFIPEGSTLTMQFVFSSEEYLEYVDAGFNDVVGVWVNGQPAELMVGTGDISVDNINDVANQNLYVDNNDDDDAFNTEMDGFTVTLTLKAPVIPDQVNTIKIGIADAGDAQYDSNLLIAGNSVQTQLIAHDDEFTMHGGKEDTVDVLGNDVHEPGASMTITHINGQEAIVGKPVELPSGEKITLNADGTFKILADKPGADDDDEEFDATFTYTVADDLGNTDVGVVKLNTLACFTAGTLIETAGGPVPVEALEPGDMVLTRDHGLQPLRWAGSSRTRATGTHAPVVIEAGALGSHGRIELSRNHRVFLSSDLAELLFGEPEVLIKAGHLVNDRNIRIRQDGGPVTYVHLLFDRHEIIRGNGLESESYHPGDETLSAFDPETRAEVLALMGESYGPLARQPLKAHEARVLLGTLH